MKKLTDEVEIVEILPVNGTPPVVTLTLDNGQSIGLSTCGGWIGHVEGQPGNPPPPSFITVTATSPQSLQTLQVLAANGSQINGTLTVVWNGTTVCSLQFQAAKISTTPPVVPGKPVPAGGTPGQFTIS